MPRSARPYRKGSWFMSSAGGKGHVKLCPVSEGMRAAQVALGKLLQKLADEKRAGEAPFAEPPRPTVEKICEEFLAVKRVEVDRETVSWYENKLAPFLRDYSAKVLGDLSYEDGVRFKGKLQERRTPKGPLKAATVNAHLRAAKAVLNWACKPSRRARTGLASNPWEEIKFIAEKPRERIITDEEMTHLLAQCEDGGVSGGAADFREQLIVLRYTTMRPGELRALRWEYIDWEQSRVVFPPSKVKTRRRREATLIDRVKAVLEERLRRLREEGAPIGFVFSKPGKDRSGQLRRAGHGGEAITANSLSQRFRRLLLRCVALGLIEKEKNGERIVPYSTRHTRATSLFMEGHSHAVVMFDMGHSVPATTERYKHLAGSFVAEEIRKADRKAQGGDSAGPSAAPQS